MHGINEVYDRESEVKNSIANAFTKSEIHKSISSIQVSLKMEKKEKCIWTDLQLLLVISEINKAPSFD